MSLLGTLPNTTGVLICGHGSRAKIAEQEFSLLAAGLRKRFAELKIEYGFLEYSSPNIHTALDKLRESGVRDIIAVPGMLLSATHAQNDIPSVLMTYMEKYPQLNIQYGRELGLHSEMIKAFEARILEALGGCDWAGDSLDTPPPGALYDTMLVVVGRGTSVATANAEVAKLTRIVAENLGFGWCETVYSGVTFPSVGRGLEMAVKLGFNKIVVAPYFLFSGRLIGRINAYINKVAVANPDIQFVTADYLRDQAHVINTFIARIEETLQTEKADKEGDLMADFRHRLAAGEVKIHHHHAEFQADSNHTHHGHDHAHDHAHEHHHAPYQHIAHPHGPRTMIDENVCCCFMSQFPQWLVDEERAKRSVGTDSLCAEMLPQCQIKTST